MIQHLVLLKLKDGVTKEQTDALMEGLEKLRSVIPGMNRVTGGYNNSSEGKSGGYEFAFVVEFADTEARDTYVPHPEHQRLAKTLVRPLVEDVIVVDYETP